MEMSFHLVGSCWVTDGSSHAIPAFIFRIIFLFSFGVTILQEFFFIQHNKTVVSRK